MDCKSCHVLYKSLRREIHTQYLMLWPMHLLSVGLNANTNVMLGWDRLNLVQTCIKQCRASSSQNRSTQSGRVKLDKG